MVTVVCTGGEPPSSPLCLSWLDQAGRTVAVDGGLALFRSLGRRADLWIGDGDSLGSDLSEWRPWFVEARQLERAKDDADTEAAVYAAQEGGGEVWLLGGGGGRMDHWLSNLRLFSRVPTLKRWLTAHEQAWNLGPGETLSVPAGTVSVFPLGEGPWKVRSSGLRWPLEPVDFARWHSLSNEVNEDGGAVFVDQGRFLLMRPTGESG